MATELLFDVWTFQLCQTFVLVLISKFFGHCFNTQNSTQLVQCRYSLIAGTKTQQRGLLSNNFLAV